MSETPSPTSEITSNPENFSGSDAPSDSSGLTITCHRLNGNNFLQGSCEGNLVIKDPEDLSPVNAPIDSPVVPMTNSPTPTLNTLPENTPTPIDSLQKTPSPKQLRVYTRKRRHIPETVLQSDSCRELDLGPAAEMEEEINFAPKLTDRQENI
ncbi:hypothetical protein GOBAR_AA36757 [Gossypium barbadense]|uniref:Uncharacterized protein n=1 Tax=Gossypium barbadense TaxID=3634 RepID=A0A2P5VYQ6_GOSBA|nr:hypothetical protein GOBAR_AA36757 [Gossypium barbadense]